ncbi:MAG: hypothetical protein JWQ09_2594 [Segetibacter sp.]|nr:hypothetical protein [Segetibacter sp.]
MTKKILPFLLLIFAFFSLALHAVSQHQKAVPPRKTASKASTANYQFTYVITSSEQNTFGYDILNHNKPTIHQPSIPGQPSNKGFATKEDAAKVAKLVITKMKKNIIPPTITQEELEDLKINL